MIQEKSDSKLCTIYVARHGETEWNVKGLIQGHSDSNLTKNGIKQAKNLGRELKSINFEAVYSSDLLRARRTAEIVTLERKLAVVTQKALRERNFGELEGKTRENLKILSELKRKNVPYESIGIEADEKIVARAITLLREIAVAYTGKNVLVVSHGGLLRALLIHLGFATDDQLPPGSVSNTAYIKLKSDGIDFFIEETKGVEKKEQENTS